MNTAKKLQTVPKKESLKEQIASLYYSGVEDVQDIAREVGCKPSYVAQVLQSEGLASGYFDLYTSTARPHNVYSKYFRNVLMFKNPDAARESVRRLDRLYHYFEELGDRAGQHQALEIALIGRSRARWSGKMEEAAIFNDWLASH